MRKLTRRKSPWKAFRATAKPPSWPKHFEPRVAVAFVASSGEGREIASPQLRRSGGEPHRRRVLLDGWQFHQYGAAEPFTKTAADIPVDSHELIALCAPRPCFISYGIPVPKSAAASAIPNGSMPHGSFMAGVLAGPVYRLLGKKDFGTPGDYLNRPDAGSRSAYRRRTRLAAARRGHASGPNFPTFFQWVSQYITPPPLPMKKTAEN